MKKATATILIALICVALGINAKEPLKISILGDSYSTFEGCVTPETNAVWYFTTPKPDKTDLIDAEQTWWRILLSDKQYQLEMNNSYSGSTICNTGYNNTDSTPFSFITRMNNLGNPDLILIFGATNDSWANVPIGEWKWSDWTDEELKTFRPALAYMLENLTKQYPTSKLLYIVNDGLKSEITSSIVEACGRYAVPYIQLVDIDKTAGHPNINGMTQIATQVATSLPRE
ncbi:MAG: SGNH/GDSL hydrolase family protein [Muribaculaceae bacterium]|nr:SGNH/GDSL hydrolase family protein [Muribaculaceae bacterium]